MRTSDLDLLQREELLWILQRSLQHVPTGRLKLLIIFAQGLEREAAPKGRRG